MSGVHAAGRCLLHGVCLCLQTGLSGGSLLSLSDAVSQAARTAGVRPITSAEQLQDDLETQELKEAYSEQVFKSCEKKPHRYGLYSLVLCVCNTGHEFCWFSPHFLTVFIAGTHYHKPTGQAAIHGLWSNPLFFSLSG